MRPRKKIWLRVSDQRLRGEWRFILEDVWMYRVVRSRPEEFHMVLTSRDLKGNHAEIREKIKAHFAKRGPKIGFKGLRNELKPCPCGADVSIEGLSPSWEWEPGPTGERTGRKEWTVWCATCGRKGEMARSEQYAIKLWNRRQP